MKYVFLFLTAFTMMSCAELQQVANQFPELNQMGGLDINAGLKEALNNGISKQVTKLTKTDGFFRNEMVKILLPEFFFYHTLQLVILEKSYHLS